MYQPAHFREDSPEVLHGWIREISLGTLVIARGDELLADPLPWLLEEGPQGAGTLTGHVARANPIWKQAGNGTSALVIFQGPGSYISPNWYASKQAHGRVVPTWNYLTVHARGRLTVFEDAGRLLRLVTALTAVHEQGREPAWKVADAPPDFIDSQLKAIVGLQLQIESLEGKCKASQNRPPEDRESTIAALEREGRGDIAALVRGKR